jgi:hypothetical protein
MIPELTDSCEVESFQCYGPCGLLTTFILSPVQSCLGLIVGDWPASVGNGTQIEERCKRFFGCCEAPAYQSSRSTTSWEGFSMQALSI